ncbi:MAG: hypothetical protein JWP71_1989 [Mucilaginibacter sp.]|nr:hypothetical protein [Mucilaginibacter sp.]
MPREIAFKMQAYKFVAKAISIIAIWPLAEAQRQ